MTNWQQGGVCARALNILPQSPSVSLRLPRTPSVSLYLPLSPLDSLYHDLRGSARAPDSRRGPGPCAFKFGAVRVSLYLPQTPSDSRGGPGRPLSPSESDSDSLPVRLRRSLAVSLRLRLRRAEPWAEDIWNPYSIVCQAYVR